MFACLKCYLACVRLRAKKYFAGQKRTTGGMNKTTVMEFFEACNALMAMPVCMTSRTTPLPYQTASLLSNK